MTQSCSGESEQAPNPVVAPDPQQKVLSKYLEERRDEYWVLQLEPIGQRIMNIQAGTTNTYG